MPIDLDYSTALAAADPGDMLAAVASAGDQVRQALIASGEVRSWRHRAHRVAPALSSWPGWVVGIAGHVLQAAAGPEIQSRSNGCGGGRCPLGSVPTTW